MQHTGPHKALTRWAALLAVAALLGACAEQELILEGPRFPVDTDLSTLAAVDAGEPAPTPPAAQAENRAPAISLPAATTNAAWTHRGGSVRHTGPHGRLSAQPVRVWSATVGEGNSRRARIEATPVAADGRIFAMDARARVTALSTGGGTLWSTDLTASFDRGGQLSGGGLAYGEGRLFASTGFGEVVAIEAASGNVIWRQRLDASVSGAPAVDGGVVYVVARDGTGWALRADTGRVIWQSAGAPSVSGFTGGSAPAVADGTVIIPYSSGDVTALLRQSGTELWASGVAGNRPGRPTGSMSNITGDPVVSGAVTYVGTSGGRTSAFGTRSGDLIWSAVEGALNPVVPVGGSVFLVNDEGRLVRLNAADGAVIWSVAMPFFADEKIKRRKAVFAHYGPVLAGGRLAVASSDGLLRLFDPRSGAMVATAEIPGGAASAPILANGALYVMGGDGQLHAFR